jgi:transcriptional regulator with XRE-family HTH domain
VEGLMTDAHYTYTAGIPATRVGALLGRARLAAGVSDRAVAGRLRVRLRTVRDWERGQIVPNDDQIDAIALACGLRVTELLPRRSVLMYDPATGVLQLGSQSTLLPTAMRTNDDVLGAFLSLVRRERGVRADRDVTVRGDDLEALAEALDLDDEELEERLVRIVGLSRRQAAAVRAQLVRRRLTVGVVGMLAGISLVAANRTFTTGTEHVNAIGGGRLVRGDPFARVTTTVAASVATIAPPTTIVVASSAAPLSTTTAATPPLVTSPGPPPTLPAVVLAEQVDPAPGQAGRTGPPRTTPRPAVATPVTHPAEPTTGTTPTTVVLPGPPTLDPPATTATTPAPTTTATTSGPDAPPPPPTSGPVVSTIGGGGTTGSTEAPPPPTTTTEPTTTTTTEPPTTTTEATTTTQATTTTEATTTTTAGP